MQIHQRRATAESLDDRALPYGDLLRGYRFRVCTDPASFAAALDVRRRVYQGGCGYDVPVPDEYDGRSWLLLAEHVETGETVGTMRITPRSAGPLEAEEYFHLPRQLRHPRTVEVTRFAILPAHRRSDNMLPAVSFGLFKLLINFLEQIGAERAVVCSKEERAWTYEWLSFERTGLSTCYTKLANAEHHLLCADLRAMRNRRDHELWPFIFAMQPAEVVLPEITPNDGPVRHLGPQPTAIEARA